MSGLQIEPKKKRKKRKFMLKGNLSKNDDGLVILICDKLLGNRNDMC